MVLDIELLFKGKSIVLNLGYSHPVEMEIPEGISIEVKQNTNISISL